ncbi:hypothetical protein MHYP_G00235760 [Metynnis hypsauchen]
MKRRAEIPSALVLTVTPAGRQPLLRALRGTHSPVTSFSSGTETRPPDSSFCELISLILHPHPPLCSIRTNALNLHFCAAPTEGAEHQLTLRSNGGLRSRWSDALGNLDKNIRRQSNVGELGWGNLLSFSSNQGKLRNGRHRKRLIYGS